MDSEENSFTEGNILVSQSKNFPIITTPNKSRKEIIKEKLKDFVFNGIKQREEESNNELAIFSKSDIKEKDMNKLNNANVILQSSVLGQGITSQNQLVSPSQSYIRQRGQTEAKRKVTILQQHSNETNNNSCIESRGITQTQIGGSGLGENLGFSLSHSSKQVFSEKLMGGFGKQSKFKGINSIIPMIFQKKSTEKNLESNISKLVRFVKLKKKAVELKRNVLRDQFIKYLISKVGNPYSKVLDDKVNNFSHEKDENNICFNQSGSIILQILGKFLKKIPTIEPSSKFKLIWDLVIATVFMIYFFFIPVHVAINDPLHKLITIQLGYTLHVLMGVDVLFSMITGYFEKGINISDQNKIIEFYMKNFFWSDILAQVPLLVSELGSTDSQVEKIFVMCFFVKLRNFQKIFRKLEESFHLSPRVSNMISLIKLILVILFFAHFFACLWLFVAYSEDYYYPQTWLKKLGMQGDDWKDQYIAAYYFSTVTMITVGYGDINPQNNLERVVSTGTMLISCVIFAYTINQIGTIFADLFSQDRQVKEFFYIINDYMDNKNIGFSLQYKIREYLDFYWREQDQNKSELEKKIIDSLSEQLREKLMIEANRIVLKDSGIFNNNFNSAIILKMVPIISTIHTTPNQVIYQEGQIDDDMFIYFIEKGKIEVCREFISSDGTKVPKAVATLGPGNSFGSYSFITNLERREMIRSSEVKRSKNNILIYFKNFDKFSKLLMVRRSDFLDLLKESPHELEKFHELKDSILMENNSGHLEIKCNACQSFNHEIQHCHHFHYSPDKYVIIRRYNIKLSKQERDKYARKEKPVQIKPNLNFKDLKFTINNNIQNKCKQWKSDQEEISEQYKLQYLSTTFNLAENEYEDLCYEEGISEQESDEFDGEELSEEEYEYSREDQEMLEQGEEQKEQGSRRKRNKNYSDSSMSENSIISLQMRRKSIQNQEIIREESRENDLNFSNLTPTNTQGKKRKSKQLSPSYINDLQMSMKKSIDYDYKQDSSNKKNKFEIEDQIKDNKRITYSNRQGSQLSVSTNFNNQDDCQQKRSPYLNANNLEIKSNNLQPNYKYNRSVSQIQSLSKFKDQSENQIQDTKDQKSFHQTSPKQVILKVPSLHLDKSRELSSKDYSPELISLKLEDSFNKDPPNKQNFNKIDYKDSRQLEFEAIQLTDDFNFLDTEKNQSIQMKTSFNRSSQLILSPQSQQFGILMSQQERKSRNSFILLSSPTNKNEIEQQNAFQSECSLLNNPITSNGDPPSLILNDQQQNKEQNLKGRKNKKINTVIESKKGESEQKRRSFQQIPSATFCYEITESLKSDSAIELRHQIHSFKEVPIENNKQSQGTIFFVNQQDDINQYNRFENQLKVPNQKSEIREKQKNNFLGLSEKEEALSNHNAQQKPEYDFKIENFIKENSNSRSQQSRRNSNESNKSSSSYVKKNSYPSSSSKTGNTNPSQPLKKKSNFSKQNKERGGKSISPSRKSQILDQYSSNKKINIHEYHQQEATIQNSNPLQKSKNKNANQINLASRSNSINLLNTPLSFQRELPQSPLISNKQLIHLKNPYGFIDEQQVSNVRKLLKKDEPNRKSIIQSQIQILSPNIQKNMISSNPLLIGARNFVKQSSSEAPTPLKIASDQQKGQYLLGQKELPLIKTQQNQIQIQKSFESPTGSDPTNQVNLKSPPSLGSPLIYSAANNNNGSLNIQKLIGEEVFDNPDNQIFLLIDFDEMKNFKFYFPKFNCSKILQQFLGKSMLNHSLKILKKVKKTKTAGGKRNNKLEEIFHNDIRRNSLVKKNGTLKKSVISLENNKQESLNLSQNKNNLNKKKSIPIETESLSLISLDKDTNAKNPFDITSSKGNMNNYPKSIFKNPTPEQN